MDEARAIELETRLAYQEATLRDLNDVIARQQQQIERLEQMCRQLSERIGRMSQPVEKLDPADEVPPHY
jgi:SlyX protein